jgi:nucleoid DNA-binding protein
MNKQDITNQIVELSRGNGKREVTQLQARYVLTMFGVLALDALKAKEPVTCFGLGKLVPAIAKARKGRNPRTGAPINIPAKLTIKLTLLGRLQKGL